MHDSNDPQYHDYYSLAALDIGEHDSHDPDYHDYHSLSGFFDDIVTAGKDVLTDTYEDIKGEATDKIAEEKQRTQDKINDALNIEKRASEEFEKKFSAELERASNNLTVSLVGLFSDEEIQQKVAEGVIVLGPDGKVVRDVKTGEVLSLIEYKEQRRQITGGWLAAITAFLTAYRDDPVFRAQHNTKVQAAINAASGATRTKLIDDYKKLQEWLTVNPSSNLAARTPAQLQRIESIKVFFANTVAAAIEGFKKSPARYEAWKNEMRAKLSQTSDPVQIAKIQKQMADVETAVKSTQAASVFLETLAKQNAEAIVARNEGSLLADTAASIRDNSGGLGVALAVGGLLWFLLSPAK